RQERRPPLCDDETTARVAVEPMRELETGAFARANAQCFDHTTRDTAAAVYRHTAGFVEHDHAVILVKDRALEPVDHSPRTSRAGPAAPSGPSRMSISSRLRLALASLFCCFSCCTGPQEPQVPNAS